MLPLWEGGTPYHSSPPLVLVSRHGCCLLLFLVALLPPLELTFHLPIPVCVVVVSMFGIEGSHPFACMHWQARWFVSVVGGRCRPPPSASIEHAPPPLEVLLPHSPPSLDARQTRGHCAPGAQLPASSVRGIGARRGDGTVTLVARGGLRTQVFRGRQSLFGGFRWVDGVGGRVYVESSLDGAGEGSSSSEETRPSSLMLLCLFCRRGGYDVGWFRPRAGLICWSM